MKALLVVRPDAATRPGGDLVHARRTGESLREIGIDVELVSSGAPDCRGYDIVHLFGVFEPDTARRQIDAVRARGAPLVLSPIWLDLRAFFAIAPRVDHALEARTPARVEACLARLRRAEQRLPWTGRASREADRRLAAQRALLLQADVLLPASEVEAYLYGERLRVTDVPIVVAPLGADTAGAPTASGDTMASGNARATGDATASGDRTHGVPERRGVLCAARVEPKKNQAALLYALRDVDVDVTLVGDAYDVRYLALCKRWATPRTRFIGHVERSEALRLMASAAVHAHPSWLESPGLSSLEAAAGGARIVAGDRGCEREYFGADSDYADPSDPASIRAAVLRALARGPRVRGDALGRRLAGLTWRRTAEATLDAYARAIAKRR